MGRPFPRKISNYEWAQLVSVAPTNVPAASKVIIGSFQLTEPNDITLMRTRGILHVVTDLPSTEEQVGAFGFMLVTETAFAAGVASIPGPVTNGNEDWPIWVPICQNSIQLGSTNFETSSGRQMVIDSKAQRVWEIGQRLVIMAENSHAAHAFDVMISLRILTRLRT